MLQELAENISCRPSNAPWKSSDVSRPLCSVDGRSVILLTCTDI